MMLVRALISLAVFTGAAIAFPAASGDGPAAGAVVQNFKSGSFIDLDCPNVEQADDDAVRVVMYPGSSDTSSGVGGVLVLDQIVDAGVVHARIPNIPDLKDHVVQVKVFYSSASGSHACDAGRIRLN